MTFLDRNSQYVHAEYGHEYGLSQCNYVRLWRRQWRQRAALVMQPSFCSKPRSILPPPCCPRGHAVAIWLHELLLPIAKRCDPSQWLHRDSSRPTLLADTCPSDAAIVRRLLEYQHELLDHYQRGTRQHLANLLRIQRRLCSENELCVRNHVPLLHAAVGHDDAGLGAPVRRCWSLSRCLSPLPPRSWRRVPTSARPASSERQDHDVPLDG
jgi:hypothetical protein